MKKYYMVDSIKYMGDFIRKIKYAGYELYMVKNQKMVQTYFCYKCRNKTMVKAYKYGLHDDRWNACKCGYRGKFVSNRPNVIKNKESQHVPK